MSERYKLSPYMNRFVEQSLSFFPSSITAQGIDAERKAYDLMANKMSLPRPAEIEVCDIEIGGINVRNYLPGGRSPSGRVLFVHGGGWYLGNLDSHDSFCGHLSNDCSIAVTSVDYRLAPEFPYPAALDDVYSVYKAMLVKDRIPPLVVGDSAGGNLIAALSFRCRRLGAPMPTAQILIYPCLAKPGSLKSHNTLSDAPLLSSDSINQCWKGYHNGQFDELDEEMLPLLADSFEGLPPASVFAAEYDPLVDDAKEYFKNLRQAGNPAHLCLVSGMVHGGLRAHGYAPEGDILYNKICQEVKKRR